LIVLLILFDTITTVRSNKWQVQLKLTELKLLDANKICMVDDKVGQISTQIFVTASVNYPSSYLQVT